MLEDELKKKMEYRDQSKKCLDCMHFEKTHDDLLSRHCHTSCTLNPAHQIKVSPHGFCKFWERSGPIGV